jgi:hypothetical protein
MPEEGDGGALVTGAAVADHREHRRERAHEEDGGHADEHALDAERPEHAADDGAAEQHEQGSAQEALHRLGEVVEDVVVVGVGLRPAHDRGRR